jgi:hypothetical protein
MGAILLFMRWFMEGGDGLEVEYSIEEIVQLV